MLLNCFCHGIATGGLWPLGALGSLIFLESLLETLEKGSSSASLSRQNCPPMLSLTFFILGGPPGLVTSACSFVGK